jgi:aspartate dehydrogenase
MRRVGLLGAGAIGMAVVQAFEARKVASHTLASILVRPRQVEALKRLNGGTLVTDDPAEFLDAPTDVVVEAIGHDATLTLGPSILERGRDVYLMSVGVLADQAVRTRFREAAALHAARVVIPSGALAGFDGLRALSKLDGCEVTYTSTKPPSAWDGTPGEDLIRARGPDEVVEIFDGPAALAALQFPKNANLAAAVALAGVGFERTRVRLVSDPNCLENVGEIEARTPSSVLQLSLSGRSFLDNPKSSQITVASIVAALVSHGDAVAWG